MRKVLYFFRQIGWDPIRTMNGLRNFPKYLLSLLRFFILIGPKNSLRISPVLNDFGDSAGSADGHYFWQDLICAQWINELSPHNHLDVGSRVDGFVAHLLAFREVTLLDIRPLKVKIPNLKVIIGNAQNNLNSQIGIFNSVSSLHSIEHFGLGRYGDPLDPIGHEKGLRSIADCVEKGGSLFVSFPIGESAVEFNEQRIIDPNWAIEILEDFEICKFVLIPWKGQPVWGLTPREVDLSIKGQAGLYWLKRK